MSEESARPDPRAATEAWMLASSRARWRTPRRCSRPDLGEDVVHDCYVRLLEKADTYNLLRDGTKFLYKSITHACIDKNYRDRRLLSLEA